MQDEEEEGYEVERGAKASSQGTLTPRQQRLPPSISTLFMLRTRLIPVILVNLTLMTSEGKAFGFVNAEELTAYRTALASSLLMSRRSKIKTITVFGAGKQAYWHIRLALMLHGKSIHNVHIHVHRFTVATKEFFRRTSIFEGVLSQANIVVFQAL
jgi:ornithine cyclodeaminase/alanine dehydrogenase-like protein (mu-crystallin family)